MANNIAIAQRTANNTVADTEAGVAILHSEAHADVHGDVFNRQVTPASILSISDRGKQALDTEQLSATLTEVGQLRNEIASMEAVLHAVKGTVLPPHA